MKTINAGQLPIKQMTSVWIICINKFDQRQEDLQNVILFFHYFLIK